MSSNTNDQKNVNKFNESNKNNCGTQTRNEYFKNLDLKNLNLKCKKLKIDLQDLVSQNNIL